MMRTRKELLNELARAKHALNSEKTGSFKYHMLMNVIKQISIEIKQTKSA